MQDLTHFRQTEQHLLRLLARAARAGLIEGVAPELRNLLTVILGYLEVELQAADLRGGGRRHLERVQQAATGLSGLTEDLLALAWEMGRRRSPIDLNGLLRRWERMLRSLVPENIELKLAPASELARAVVSPMLIVEVLLHLVTNAIEAMPRGGELTLLTSNAVVGEDFARAHCDMASGQYVTLSVSDTGCGMSDEVRQRIFEPFFTTKDGERYAGLGLTFCKAAVQESGGNLTVDTSPGLGTIITVYLPRVRPLAEGNGPSADPTSARAVP